MTLNVVYYIQHLLSNKKNKNKNCIKSYMMLCLKIYELTFLEKNLDLITK